MATLNIIIPAYNEEDSLPYTLELLSKLPYQHTIIVCDNNSTDNTQNIALKYNTKLTHESKQGYGSACLKALKQLDNDCEIILFIDSDYNDDLNTILRILDPIKKKKSDFTLGARNIYLESKNELMLQARFGNWLSTFLIKRLWKFRYSDLGPLRAITKDKLEILNMQDENFGWTIEMQIKAIKKNLKILEIPIQYTKRNKGSSKITGTIKGSIFAGIIILYTIAKLYILQILEPNN